MGSTTSTADVRVAPVGLSIGACRTRHDSNSVPWPGHTLVDDNYDPNVTVVRVWIEDDAPLPSEHYAELQRAARRERLRVVP
jgi:hypothetical protein